MSYILIFLMKIYTWVSILWTGFLVYFAAFLNWFWTKIMDAQWIVALMMLIAFSFVLITIIAAPLYILFCILDWIVHDHIHWYLNILWAYVALPALYYITKAEEWAKKKLKEVWKERRRVCGEVKYTPLTEYPDEKLVEQLHVLNGEYQRRFGKDWRDT